MFEVQDVMPKGALSGMIALATGPALVKRADALAIAVVILFVFLTVCGCTEPIDLTLENLTSDTLQEVSVTLDRETKQLGDLLPQTPTSMTFRSGAKGEHSFHVTGVTLQGSCFSFAVGYVSGWGPTSNRVNIRDAETESGLCVQYRSSAGPIPEDAFCGD